MKFRIPNNLSQTPAIIARKAGYLQIKDSISDKISYVRKLTSQHYPRFHLYITENEKEVVFDLHLDQAKTRYKGQTAHNADYETEEVKQELTRFYHVLGQFIK